MPKQNRTGECASCKATRRIAAKGLCDSCYHHLWRKVGKAKPREAKAEVCVDCQRPGIPISATNRCHACYNRFRRGVAFAKTPRTNTQPPEGFRKSVPAPSPTTAQPGSREKLRVMRQRARFGTSLFHPADATFEIVIERLLDAA